MSQKTFEAGLEIGMQTFRCFQPLPSRVEKSNCRVGVTIIELVVVLAIISILGLIAFPAIQRARESARELVCKNNLRQLNLTMQQHSEAAGIPPFNREGTISGWTIEILPYLEQDNLKNALPTGRPLENLNSSYFRQPATLRCPTQAAVRNESPAEISPAHYLLVTSPIKAKRKFFSFAEAPTTRSDPWVTSPESTDFDSLFPGVHNGGFYYVSGLQGGVKFISAND